MQLYTYLFVRIDQEKCDFLGGGDQFVDEIDQTGLSEVIGEKPPDVGRLFRHKVVCKWKCKREIRPIPGFGGAGLRIMMKVTFLLEFDVTKETKKPWLLAEVLRNLGSWLAQLSWRCYSWCELSTAIQSALVGK